MHDINFGKCRTNCSRRSTLKHKNERGEREPQLCTTHFSMIDCVLISFDMLSFGPDGIHITEHPPISYDDYGFFFVNLILWCCTDKIQ